VLVPAVVAVVQQIPVQLSQVAHQEPSLVPATPTPTFCKEAEPSALRVSRVKASFFTAFFMMTPLGTLIETEIPGAVQSQFTRLPTTISP
jgi:hypothetical protein